MDQKDKEAAIKRYENRFQKYGESVKTMGWRDDKQQELRFRILKEIGELNHKKILDVGCGFGDFYGYLSLNGCELDYTGYDISEKIVEVARKKHQQCIFEVKDILTENIQEKYDYVFCSGVFNHRISDNYLFTHKMIDKMFKMSRYGIAVNMMTDYVDFKEEHLFYYSPEKVFKFAKGLTRYVVMRHDYPLYEFTLYLLREIDI